MRTEERARTSARRGKAAERRARQVVAQDPGRLARNNLVRWCEDRGLTPPPRSGE